MSRQEDWEKPLGRLKDTVELHLSDEVVKQRMRPEESDLYDPSSDLNDELWLRNNLKTGSGVLSCPGCFSQICYMYEPHTTYEGQYRAQSVQNCVFGSELETQEGDKFVKVVCEECGAEVGVWEVGKEVYHLFHVLPSS